MNRPILLVVVPEPLSPVLGTALSLHPEITLRDGVAVGRLRAALDAHTRARVHSDKMPWDTGSDWVDDIVAEQLASVTRGDAATRSVWRCHDAASARTLSRMLDATPLVWIADGRHALPAAPDGVDPVTSAVDAGRAWARDTATAEALPGAVTIQPQTPPAALLTALGLPRHAPTEQALAMLGRLGPPRLPAARDGAFTAWPPAAERLTALGPTPRAAPTHPAVAAARAQWAAEHDQAMDAAALARQALAADPAPAVRRQAIDALLRAGHTDEAVAQLERWRRSTDHPWAWSGLLALRDHQAAAALAPDARRHRDPAVRGALARWLVAGGLDRQAAEAVCRVRDTNWFSVR